MQQVSLVTNLSIKLSIKKILETTFIKERVPLDIFRAVSSLGHVIYTIRGSEVLSITDFNEGAAQPKVVEKRRGDKCVKRSVKVNKRKEGWVFEIRNGR